ncbi:MAG: hypothetical protein AABZ23_02055 [Deltaproteobacteria bacterium]
MLTKRRVLAAKIESAEGQGQTLAAADGGILVFDPKIDIDIKKFERSAAKASLSNLTPVFGTQAARLTFRAELKGPGAAYSSSNLPAIAKYLRACGFAETIVTTPGSESATYAPASTGIPTITLGLYEDGVLKKIHGARGNVKIIGKVGEPLMADFEFMGLLDSVADGAMITPTYEGTIPPVFLNSTFTIASYAAVIAGIELDMANALQMREDVTKSSGFASCAMTGRNPNGKFDPEMTPVATHDWFGRWKAGTAGALTVGPVGATQYNKVAITAPKVVYTKVSDSSRNDMAVADTSFALAMNTGDDEVQIQFT